MARVFLFVVLFFLVNVSWSADYQRTIKWFESLEGRGLGGNPVHGFEGSVTIDQTGLPYYFESFDWNSSEVDLLVGDLVYEPVLQADSKLVDSCNDELNYHTERGSSAGKSILRLTIFPFIKKNNRIERLVAFTISLKEKPSLLKSAKAAYRWKPSSVLATGKWVKVKTKAKGIYKVTYDQLKTWGFNNPESVSVYGNGGLLLPVMNKDTRFDDLGAYPVWKGKDNAGKDCLFFYSSGNISYSQNLETGLYTHQQNVYATETYFYLTDTGTPKLVEKTGAIAEPDGRKVYSFTNYVIHEKESLNLISSGSQWFGEKFGAGSSQTINMVLDNPDLTKPARFAISVAGRSSAPSSLEVALNGKTVNNISFNAVNLTDVTSYYADTRKSEFAEIATSKNLQVRITYAASNSMSDAWLDYIGINYESMLNMISDFYFFRGRGVDGAVQVSEFVLNATLATTKIFDVTDLNNTTEVPAVYSDGQTKFKSNSALMREYVAFNPAGAIPTPEFVGVVANQNLHAAETAEMIIVANPALVSAANELANFHQNADQMTVKVVTPDLVYNEFSGGLPDPSGFRNYFRMCYDRGTQPGKSTLKYILLLGDGSYDNRNILGKNLNLLPTFQSDNSISPTESFVSDDFFVFLDENEGGYSGTVDLGIGRIPARSLYEAETVVNKIKNYHSKEALGNWRNVVSFIGDDEDYSTHMWQAETLANLVNDSYPAFYTDKIYFDAYKQQSTPSGEKYPDVTIAINSRVKQGALVLNYTGHANEKNLSDEKVLEIADINSWTNFYRLPIFVTATCEYSRFDSNETSAGEHILFNPRGGGIGLFSTTRLVYSGANFVLNRQFFKYIFERDQQGNRLRLGDVMRLAKATANTGINQLNFTLLGDPALKLAYPQLQVKTSSINGKDVNAEKDTIQTLSVVTIKGIVADQNGVKLTSFNGDIIPTVYDKAMQVKTLGNGGQEKMDYTVQNNIIYRGLASVKNGEFEFSFFVPKDISYKLDRGKIMYYAYNESVDAHGYFDGFYVGGSSNNTIADSNGPDIELFLNSESFKNGGTVSASSVLIANIKDATGINTAGTGIGHDITAVLNGDYSNIIVLNDYFQSSKDKYTEGTIVFPLTNLPEGKHTLILKVWDVLNNSSEVEISFVVRDDFRIESVMCYPNPVQESTSFVFAHNQPDETFDVVLEVFQTTGSRIDMLQQTVGSFGTESQPLSWNPASRLVKMRPGTYIYRLSVTTKDGKVSDGSGRLVYVYR
jgi:hypothetical protein